jgi:hypothetical protein
MAQPLQRRHMKQLKKGRQERREFDVMQLEFNHMWLDVA